MRTLPVALPAVRSEEDILGPNAPPIIWAAVTTPVEVALKPVLTLSASWPLSKL